MNRIRQTLVSLTPVLYRAAATYEKTGVPIPKQNQSSLKLDAIAREFVSSIVQSKPAPLSSHQITLFTRGNLKGSIYGAALDATAPLKPIDASEFTKYTAEDIESGKHFDVVKDQAAQFLSITESLFMQSIEKKAPLVGQDSLSLIDSKGKPVKDLEESKKSFFKDARKLINAFSLAMPNRPAAEAFAVKELYEFIIKYDGKADRFQNKSLPELKAIIQTDLRIIAELKAPNPDSEYRYQQLQYLWTKVKDETIGKGLGLNIAAIGAVAAAIFGWVKNQTPEERKKAALELAKTKVHDYKSSVASRKEAEQNLATQKRAVEMLKDPLRSTQNHEMTLAHLAQILDEEYPFALDQKDLSALREVIINQEECYKNYNLLVDHHEKVRNELSENLKKNPQLKEDIIKERALASLKQNNQSPYNLFGKETTDFKNAKETVRKNLEILFQEIKMDKPPELRIDKNFKDILGVDSGMVANSKKYYEQLNSQISDKKTADPLRPIISQIEANCSKLKGSVDTVKILELSANIQKQIQDLKQAERQEHSLKAASEKELESIIVTRLDLERKERSLSFNQIIQPCLTKVTIQMLGVINANLENKEAFESNKSKICASLLEKDNGAQKSFVTRFFKGKFKEDVSDDERNEFIDTMSSYLAAKNVYTSVQLNQILVNSESTKQNLQSNIEKLAIVIQSLELMKNRLENKQFIS